MTEQVGEDDDRQRSAGFSDSSSGQHAKGSQRIRQTKGENLLRDLEMLRDRAEYFARQNRHINSLDGVGFGQSKRFDTLSGVSFGGQKRNFDEIDRSGFDRFIKKNFDEIDRSVFDRFVKKNFDEIDRSAFSSFVKRPNKAPAANLE
ncbi:PREDICTED: orcokinin peptides type A-like [Diuraphis noxia]|uniref:orcokinin peptides type A-like n=1 Tax=Diuraphis noxia TaxID=143948 RepID=UPI0007637BF3|nr:PREDICTED: orcokinin peptides type A-like [Diuraphis noxia]